MGVYATLHVKGEVFDLLSAKKSQLEQVYKKEVTWSDFMRLLVKNGTCEKVLAQDIKEVREFEVIKVRI